MDEAEKRLYYDRDLLRGKYVIVDARAIPIPASQENVKEIREYDKTWNPSLHRESISLGPITCIGNFESNKPVRGENDRDCSMLTLVWFQEQYAMPIDPVVLKKIKAFDWEGEAENFFW